MCTWRGGDRWWSCGVVASRTAALWCCCGGEKRFPSSSPLLFLPFSLFSVFFSFCFSFYSFLFPSISLVLSLSSVSSLSPVSPPKKSVPLSPSVSPFIEKKHGAGMLFVRAFNHATAGRPLGRVWWRWGRGERRGRIFEIFAYCSAKTGGEGDDEQCRSKRHRSVFLIFFFFFFYI